MIPNLRARLNEIAAKAEDSRQKPKEAPEKRECRVLETRVPLPEMCGLAFVTAEHVFAFADVDTDWQLCQTLFIDTETTGLRGAGTVAFLIGLGWVEGEHFCVRQMVMRDYPEERNMLETLQEILNGFSCVVSFNGKSFDIPLLKERFLLSRIPDPWPRFAHIDLLHAARRLWKARLGRCRLESLEEFILGITREEDIPGEQIPKKFFQYLSCGDFSMLSDVIAHNRQDIVSLAMLFSKLSSIFQAPERQLNMLDVLSAGKALEKRGLGTKARRCFQLASVSSFSRQARLSLAGSYRSEKDFHHAAGIYYEMIDHGEADALDYIALAILLEHRLRDACSALSITEKAILRFSGESLWRTIDESTLEALYRRRKRLLKKV